MTDEINRSRFLLSMVTIFFWSSEYCHVPYFTPYLRELGLTASLIGLLVGTYGFTQMCVRIPLGIGTDITGKYKAVVIGGAFFTTISSLGLFLFKNTALLFIFRAFAGVAASSWIAFTVMYSSYFTPDEGVKAMARINGFNNTGKLLAFVLGTATATCFGYKAPLLISCITGAIAIVLALFLKDMKVKKTPMKVKDIFMISTNRHVICPAIFAAMVMMIVHATAFSFTSDVARSVGATTTQIGINTSLYTIIQIVAAGFIGSAFIKRRKRSLICLGGFAMMALYCLMIGFAPNIYIIFLAQLIGGFGHSLVFAILMSACVEEIEPERKATAMGLFQAIYGIGMTMGPVWMGRLAQSEGFTGGYTVFAVVSLVTALLSFLVFAKL